MVKHPKPEPRREKSADQGVRGVRRLIPSNKPEYIISAIEKRKRTAGMVSAEIWLPKTLRDAVIARGETLQDAAQKAFRLLMAHWESNQES